MMEQKRQELTRFLRFAVVGAIGAVVDFGIFNLLAGTFGVRAVAASVISFVCAVVSNFLWNRYWTYPDSRSKSVTHQVVQFVAVSTIGLAIRTPLFAFLESHLINMFRRVLPTSSISPVFAGHNLALAIGIAVVMVWNFLANRYWTYNDVDRPDAPIANQG